MKIFGQLEKAQLENLTADPTGAGLIPGRIWYRSDTNEVKYYDGAIVQTISGASAADVSSFDAIVGSALDVANGLATHTTLTAAIAAISAGQSILVLPGTVTDNPTVNKKCHIVGMGAGSILSGNLVFNASADESSCKFLRVTGNVTFDAGADKINFSDFWCANASVITDNGSSNYILGIRD